MVDAISLAARFNRCINLGNHHMALSLLIITLFIAEKYMNYCETAFLILLIHNYNPNKGTGQLLLSMCMALKC